MKDGFTLQLSQIYPIHQKKSTWWMIVRCYRIDYFIDDYSSTARMVQKVLLPHVQKEFKSRISSPQGTQVDISILVPEKKYVVLGCHGHWIRKNM